MRGFPTQKEAPRQSIHLHNHIVSRSTCCTGWRMWRGVGLRLPQVLHQAACQWKREALIANCKYFAFAVLLNLTPWISGMQPPTSAPLKSLPDGTGMRKLCSWPTARTLIKLLIVHTENCLQCLVLHGASKMHFNLKNKNGPKIKMNKKSQAQPYVSLRPFLRHFRFAGLGYRYYQPRSLMFCWWLQPAVKVFKQSRRVPKLPFWTRRYLSLTLCWSWFKLLTPEQLQKHSSSLLPCLDFRQQLLETKWTLRDICLYFNVYCLILSMWHCDWQNFWARTGFVPAQHAINRDLHLRDTDLHDMKNFAPILELTSVSHIHQRGLQGSEQCNGAAEKKWQ